MSLISNLKLVYLASVGVGATVVASHVSVDAPYALAPAATGLAGLLTNLVASAIIALEEKRVRSVDQILRNGYLTTAVGRAIGVLTEQVAKMPMHSDYRDAFLAFARAMPEKWIAFVEESELVGRFHETTSAELPDIFGEAAGLTEEPPLMDAARWDELLRHISSHGPHSNSPMTDKARAILAPWLCQGFVHSLRQILTEDNSESAQAFRRLTLDFFGALLATARRTERNTETLLTDTGDILIRTQQVLEAVEGIRSNNPHAALPAPQVYPASLFNNKRPFVGREAILARIESIFEDRSADCSWIALTGMPGVGKSATAFAYVQAHRAHYKHIFWLNTRDDADKRPDDTDSAWTEDQLLSAYDALGRKLNSALPGDATQDQGVDAALAWLASNDGWLLVLDNADGVRHWDERLLPVHGGRLLITARPGILRSGLYTVPIETMTNEEGASCLLGWAGRKESDPERAIARKLSTDLGGLPLALEQAGAFIAVTGVSVSQYRELYAADPGEILLDNDVSPSVRTVRRTFGIALHEIGQSAPAVAELLRLCAFLAPDSIPVRLFTELHSKTEKEENARILSAALAEAASRPVLWQKLRVKVRDFALLRFADGAGTCSMHRVVRTLIRAEMKTDLQKLYVERAAALLWRSSPSGDFGTWEDCELLLPHQSVCLQDIERLQIKTPEALMMCSLAGYYLLNKAAYASAAAFLVRDPEIYESVLGLNHPDTATTLNHLAMLYFSQNDYAAAEPLYKRALAIRESALGANHSDTASTLNDLAELYRRLGNYAAAEPLFKRALAVSELILGPDHPDTASTLNNLAGFYYSQKDYVAAEPLFKRALAVYELVLGANHPDTATALNNLAGFYYSQSDYVAAEPLYKRALAIRESALGANHSDTASTLNNLASLYFAQGNYAAAEPLYKRARAIRESLLGANHPDTVTTTRNLAKLYHTQGHHDAAESLFHKATTTI